MNRASCLALAMAGASMAPAPVDASATEREVLVMLRSAQRGSALSCADLAVQRRAARLVPPQAAQPPCALPPGVVLRRTLAAGDALREGDAGPAPAVSARGPVSVRVVVGTITLDKAGTALSDGELGDRVRVRLNGTTQELSGRVVASKVVAVEAAQ